MTVATITPCATCRFPAVEGCDVCGAPCCAECSVGLSARRCSECDFQAARAEAWEMENERLAALTAERGK